MAMHDVILDARNLHAWYGSSHVLHGVDLQIARGETVGLLGRNGMGKSTLIRTLLGHVAQRDGQIQLFGRDLSRGKPHEVARLGVAYVPEGRGVFPNLSVKENLVMAAKPPGSAGRPGRGWSYGRVMDTFPRLKEREGNLGAQLSGGEQQMLSIARALLTNPAVLLMDEPTEGLAPVLVETLTAVLMKLRDSGLSIVLVEQNSRVALGFCERAVIMDKGRIVYDGPSAALRDDPEKLAKLVGIVEAAAPH
jgi:branched-chain amino acid transport system ATP-binding protein